MKSLLSIFSPIFVGAFLLVSCDQLSGSAPDNASPTSTSSPTSASPAAPSPPLVTGASITAEPNPVPPGDGPGTTTINWQTTDGTIGEVYVSKDGASETLFARGSTGPATAPWIVANSTYEFRLYSGTNHKTVVGRVTVTRAKQ